MIPYPHKSLINTSTIPVGTRFPQWMWQNHCFSEFAKWLRDGGKHESVNVFGLDLYSKEESLVELLRFLDVYNPIMARRVRFACPEEWPSILSKLQWAGTSPSKVL